jgi:hypothetical protein
MATAKPYQPPPVEPPPEVEVKVQPPKLVPWYLRVLPFGAGHYVQGEYVVGSVFLALELGLLGANIGLAVTNERRVQMNGHLPAGAQSAALYWAQQGTAIGAYTVFALALIDAVWLVPLRQKPVPVTLVPMPGLGVAAAGHF